MQELEYKKKEEGKEKTCELGKEQWFGGWEIESKQRLDEENDRLLERQKNIRKQ